MILTDAFQVVEVLLWFFERLELFVLVGGVHPSIFHDLLAKGRDQKRTTDFEDNGTPLVHEQRSVVGVCELAPLCKTLHNMQTVVYYKNSGGVHCCAVAALTCRLPRFPGLSTSSFFSRFSQSVDM